MKYPIILCEDNLIQLQQLYNIIHNYIIFHSEFLKVELKTQSPQEVKDFLNKFSPKNGIYFLDIDLKHKIDGIDLADIIRKQDAQAKIIFITTHDELAPLTLKRKVEALGFIAKDQEFDMFRTEVMEILDLAQERINAVKTDRKMIFTFSVGKQIYNIDMDDVLFVEPSDIPHRLTLFTKQGRYEFYGRLNDLEEKYSNLFRSSRRCLVNLLNTKEIDLPRRLLIFEEDLTRVFSLGKSNEIKKYIK